MNNKIQTIKIQMTKQFFYWLFNQTKLWKQFDIVYYDKRQKRSKTKLTRKQKQYHFNCILKMYKEKEFIEKKHTLQNDHWNVDKDRYSHEFCFFILVHNIRTCLFYDKINTIIIDNFSPIKICCYLFFFVLFKSN